MRPSAAGPGWGKTLSPQGFSGVWGWCWHSVTVLQPPSSPYEEQWGAQSHSTGLPPTACSGRWPEGSLWDVPTRGHKFLCICKPSQVPVFSSSNL